MAVLGPRRYRAVLAIPGVPRLVACFVAAGLAGAMAPVAFVLFAREATGSFAAAGLVLGALVAGGVLSAPLRGRLIDRHGARAVLLALAGPAAATDAGLILAGRADLPTGILVVVALAAGVIAAPVGTAVRALWSTAVAEADERRAGFALLTLVGEAGFLGGPLLAAAVVAVASTTAAVAVTAALGLGAAVVVAAASPRRGPLEPGARGARGPGPLRDAAVRGVVATAGCFGAAFGVLDLTLPAAARAAGTPALGGVLLAAVAAGIAVGGAVYGARSGAGPVRPVYARYSLLAAAGLAPLALLPPPAGLAALSLLAGACFGPITVVQNSVIDEIAPSAVAETYSWLATLYGTGAAAGAALAGQLVERVGLRAAPVAAVVVMAGAVVVARRTVGWRA